MYAHANGDAVGVYQGHVTVSAPGITGSPQLITVTLNVEAVANYQVVYLPLVMK